MNQIKSIQLGVIAIYIATVPLSLAQTPRTRTSGSNQTGATTTAAPIHTGSNGNSIGAPQIGVNAGIPTITGATPNIGAHTAINAGVQTRVSNQATGTTGAAMGNGGSSGNSTGATQIGINAATANTKANTNAGAQTGAAAESTQPQVIIDSSQLPIFATPTPFPTPIPTPTPIQSPSFSPSPSPSP